MADKDFDYGLPTPGVLGEDPELYNRNVWFGLLFSDGDVRVERYRSWTAYQRVGNLDTVTCQTRLFEADTIEAAIAKASGMIKARRMT